MRKWAIVGILFLLTVSVGWIVFDDLFTPLGVESETVEIPDFCGRMAQNEVFDEWIEVKWEYRHNKEVPSGEIYAQVPRAGSRRKLTASSPKCEVTLTVSLGEKFVALPSVVGQDAREAENALRAMGLAVTVERSVGAYPAGTVFAQAPRAGEEVPAGSTVVLSVCTGAPQESVRVPDLQGLTRNEALVRIWAAKLSLAAVVEEDSDLPAGTVIRQSHLPDTVVPAGTALTVFVSRTREE